MTINDDESDRIYRLNFTRAGGIKTQDLSEEAREELAEERCLKLLHDSNPDALAIFFDYVMAAIDELRWTGNTREMLHLADQVKCDIIAITPHLSK